MFSTTTTTTASPDCNDCNDYLATAARKHLLSCLKHHCKPGRIWNGAAADFCARYGFRDGLDYLFQEKGTTIWMPWTAVSATQSGHLEYLQYVHTRGAPLSPECYVEAIRQHSLPLLEYLYQHKVSWPYNVLLVAVRERCFSGFQYAHTHGAPWQSEITYLAADLGFVEFLQYSVEIRAPWHPRTTLATVHKGRLSCLRIAYENGAPWHRDIVKEAMEWDQPQILRYALQKHKIPSGALLHMCLEREAQLMYTLRELLPVTLPQALQYYLSDFVGW